MSNLNKLDRILRDQALPSVSRLNIDPYAYAECIAHIEQAIVVVSDLNSATCRIFTGKFASVLGLENYHSEDSIWERDIMDIIVPQDIEEKVIAELRFYHFMRRTPKSKRSEYFLASKLRFFLPDSTLTEVMHRMYYIYDADGDTVRYAVCIYSPLHLEMKAKSMVINSVTGISEELTSSADKKILSKRECQVLSLIDSGHKSTVIAQKLNISIHTVNRHRQEIIAKLQVKNSHQACHIAKSLHLI